MSISIAHETDIERLRQVAHLQEAELGRLHKRLAMLASELDKLKGTDHETLQQELSAIKEALNRRMRELYGPSSEKRPGNKDNNDSTDEDKKKKPKTGHGPTKQPELPIVEKVIELKEDELIDEESGEKFYEMKGQVEESQVIEVIQRSYRIVKYLRKKYSSSLNDRIITAPAPLKLIDGGRYSPDFAVHVAIQKYADHLPLARQEKIMAREGLVVTRQTLWDQIDALAAILQPSYEALWSRIKQSPIVGADETRWLLLMPNAKGKCKKWWAWSVTSEGGVAYRILDNRATNAAKKVLGDYDGLVVADGYATYGALRKDMLKESREGPVFDLAFCWAHVRRKFVKCENADPRAVEAIEQIGKLYEIERRVADECKNLPEAEYLERLGQARSEESRAVVKAFGEWLAMQKALPTSGFGRAIKYASKLWDGLIRFLDDPRIPLDNNRTERGMRSLAVGRKNHYGSKSRRGTQVAALFYSLIESAKLLGVDPQEYLFEACMRALREPGTPTLPQDLLGE